MVKPITDLSNKRYGPMIAIAYSRKNKRNQAIWLFKCDCGNELEKLATDVIDQKRKTCGRTCKFLLTKDQLKANRKAYVQRTKDNVTKYFRNYRRENKDKMKLYRSRSLPKRRDRYKNDVNHKLSERLRSRTRTAVKLGKYAKSGSAVNDLGCSIEKLKLWIEMQWSKGMSWDNYKWDGWHIDHKTPLSKFNLSNRDEFLRASHYTNLQPMWCLENLSKGNR